MVYGGCRREQGGKVKEVPVPAAARVSARVSVAAHFHHSLALHHWMVRAGPSAPVLPLCLHISFQHSNILTVTTLMIFIFSVRLAESTEQYPVFLPRAPSI